ncbi:dihydrofolate reductase [Candidatus Uhrbacteria bacterium]|nr:dihydrofolate reductase [Candidatus Uhrbacteria bacterium]
MKLILLMAQTVDGKVARARHELVNWTSKEDKKFFVSETKRVGAIIMGRTTFETFGKLLSGRTIIVMTRSPRDPLISEDGKVIFTNDTPDVILQKLEAEGRSEAILAGGPTINHLFLEKNLIDEIKISVEPRLFGDGLSIFEGTSVDLTLEFISLTHLTPSVIVLHYKVVKDS